MSPNQMVRKTIKLYYEYLRQSVQSENERCKKNKGEKRMVRRPDLQAMSIMIDGKHCLNYPIRRIGDLPGIDVGHQFYKRTEMVVVGKHYRWMHGIDYIPSSAECEMEEYKSCTFPLAVSVVLAGKYKDNLDMLEPRGGCVFRIILKKNVPVRLIRGCKYKGKIDTVFTYDGLYMVTGHWSEEGKAGFLGFKYELKRMEGQPKLNTNPVLFVREHASRYMVELTGKVCDDISGGQEKIRIRASNVVDDPPVPHMGFTYCKSVQVHGDVRLPAIETTAGCNCKGACVDPDICACAKLNNNEFPYVDIDGKGYLVRAKNVVYVYQLEVFRTPNKRWAVRSSEFIPSGAPVCEYTGLLRRTNGMGNLIGNEYILEIDCLETMKGLGGRKSRERIVPTHLDQNEDMEVESGAEFCIDAGTMGGVARFINHSCEPNLFVQCVLSSHHDLKLARVVLVASDNIPPLQELTYDYGYVLDSVVDANGNIKKMACYCGAENCRKRLY
ncbi:hypothetical protein AQUCO_11000035v1 [Aquilegia coerulea]|uniref:SET domain-containing protein n=1 Tax=Aquilegia coerulea TaxID=218851 RepID=A0A2G5C2W9_AQUCA|nr:hypothetical protein AQUCO_11000035v1 [Aquilegia coerulea]